MIMQKQAQMPERQGYASCQRPVLLRRHVGSARMVVHEDKAARMIPYHELRHFQRLKSHMIRRSMTDPLKLKQSILFVQKRSTHFFRCAVTQTLSAHIHDIGQSNGLLSLYVALRGTGNDFPEQD